MTSDSLHRIAEAIKALPREKRPYLLRDPHGVSGSLTDILTDLAPFIAAEVERVKGEGP